MELQNCNNILNRLIFIIIFRLMIYSLIVYPSIFHKQSNHAKIYLFLAIVDQFFQDQVYIFVGHVMKTNFVKIRFFVQPCIFKYEGKNKLEQK